MSNFVAVTHVGMNGKKRIYVNLDLIRSIRQRDAKNVTIYFDPNDSLVVEGEIESIIGVAMTAAV
jgi:hypothetical protein